MNRIPLRSVFVCVCICVFDEKAGGGIASAYTIFALYYDDVFSVSVECGAVRCNRLRLAGWLGWGLAMQTTDRGGRRRRLHARLLRVRTGFPKVDARSDIILYAPSPPHVSAGTRAKLWLMAIPLRAHAQRGGRQRRWWCVSFWGKHFIITAQSKNAVPSIAFGCIPRIK